MTNIRTRFAPSPTGDPQLGNMRTALFTFLFAKHTNGPFLLRIEDTDKTREVPGSIERIEQSLRWLGLDWDEGPILQSSRLALYQSAAETLIKNGHAYYCFCSAERLDQVRKDQQSKGLPPIYDKHCRTIESQEAKTRAAKDPHVIRLKVPESGVTVVTDLLHGDVTFHNTTIDDQVLLKSDGFPTYHLAVVVDDHDMHISHVIRGEDWLPSAPKYVLLYQFFNWDLPTFAHLPLIVGADKKKLSKRLGDMSVLAYKDQGYAVEAVINFLARLGFSPPDDRKLYSLTELAQVFRLEKVHLNPAIFDIDKLLWFNRLAKEKGSTQPDLIDAITNKLQEKGVIHKPLIAYEYPFIKEASKRINTVSEVDEKLSYLWERPKLKLNDEQRSGHTDEDISRVIHNLNVSAQGTATWDEESVGNMWRENQRKLGNWNSKDYYRLGTALVSGASTAPPLFGSTVLIKKEEFLKRLESVSSELSGKEKK